VNAAAIERFHAEGWCALPGFFGAREVAALQADLERLKREGLLRNVATDGDGKTTSTKVQNLQICPVSPKSPLIRALPFQPKVLEAVRALLGEPFVLYLDQIFLKPGRTGAGTGWHQDNAYFKIADPAMGTGMWIAIHDATKANGTMHVIPGSHRESFDHDRDPGSDHHIRMRAPEERAVAVELPAGGVLFFNYGVAHCTKANTTDRERAGLALHFLRTDFIPGGRWVPTTPHLAGPDATGGLQEFGRTIAGTWDAEVERALAAI
jgi:ectoine hydroxylase-related dioxygenase (phytanoyl-CoA dioxygenase family)